MSDIVTRFAPSPTGYLHLGTVYSALFTENAARETDGRFLVRIEDTDQSRCRQEFEDQILDDLRWLGLTWEEPIRRQSAHLNSYKSAIENLGTQGLIYPCFCTRKEILEEIDTAGVAPHGPDGPVYPGTCRGLSEAEREEKISAGMAYALRVDIEKAHVRTGEITWYDRDKGEVIAHPERFGDVVVARKDGWPSYHLAVTWDDHLQGITLVTRGNDLFEATDIHRLLQALLNLDTPEYHHHKLLLDPQGRRLAKRDKDVNIKSLREAGKTPDDVKMMCGWLPDD
jgi:glutamyl-Q tRNA(Asp) synthetase